MRRNRLSLFLHLVWATWDRLPMIGPDVERRIYRCIEAEAQRLGCTVLALNGMPDHVHLLVKWPTTITIAELAKQAKGVSSHFANEVLKPELLFKWQGGYGAFTICEAHVERLVGYVKRQKEHHGANDVWAEWETTFEDMPDDDRR